jgi:hypothetical protein
VSEYLKSGFDDGLGLTGTRRSTDQVWDRVTGSDDIGNGLPLDLIEILVVIEVDMGYVRGNVVFFLRPDPSSKNVVYRLRIPNGEAYLRSVYDIVREEGTHCILQITNIVSRRLEFDLIFSVAL